MRKLKRIAPLLMVLLLMALLSTRPALSQVGRGALQACREVGFSTSEDFLSRAPEPLDGNPIISDGDLLAPDGTVCARNADLLAVFEPRADLGLDAVDIIGVDRYLVAFSTELDDPGGQFTAGDLLTTAGAVIPNVALVAAFDINYDIGLDALHFVGDPEKIVAFLREVQDLGRDYWLGNPEALPGMLRQYGIDLWFSTEGTAPTVQAPLFLDGDLLSALGLIVMPNSVLLPPGVPAGIPDRGVDFGLDAFAHGRTSDIPTAGAPVRGYFSTEILYDDPDGALSFSDGDALYVGNGIAATNWGLVGAFKPRARDLGLDALVLVAEKPCQEAVEITEVGGIQVGLIDPVTGYARKATTGVASPPLPPPALAPFDRPFGQWVSIRGNVPDTGCVDVTKYEYRVEYQEGGGPWTSIITHPNWQARQAPGFIGCPMISPWLPYQSDGNGWIPLSDYWHAKACQPDQALNMWNTAGKDRSFRLRLTVRQIGLPATEIMSAEVPVSLDNTAPQPVDMTLYDAAGTTQLSNQCEVSATGPVTVTIKGQVRDNGQGTEADGDEHFRTYELRWTGGLFNGWDVIDLVPPETPGYRFYDGGRLDLDGTGTLPPAATDVPLGKFGLTAEHMAVTGQPPIKCGFTIWLRAWDRTIRGRFQPVTNGISDFYQFGWLTDSTQSFCFEPPAE